MDINRQSPGMPTTRIAWMVGLTIFLGATMFYLLSATRTQREGTLTQAEKAPREEDDFAPPLAPDDPISLSDDIAAKIDESTPLARSKIEPEPYRDLLSQVTNRTARFLKEEVGYVRADRAALLKEPAKHRGRAVFVRGTLIDFSQRLLERPLGDYTIVHFGVVEDFDGNRFWFETLNEPDVYDVGEIIVVRGVFLKDYNYIRVAGTPFNLKALPDTEDHLPLLVCKTVEASYRIAEVTELDKKLVRNVLWGSQAGERQLEVPALYHLLGYMKNADPATFPKNLKTYDDMAERLLLPTRLDKYRGEFVQLWGRLGPIYKHLDPENPAGITHHYRAYVYTPDNLLLPVFLADKPEGFEPFQDFVNVKGIFFKPWQYETDEGQSVRAPVIVAKRLTLRKIEAGPWELILWVLVSGVFIAIIGIGVLIYRDRRDLKRHNEEFIRRRRERRERRLGAEAK